MLKKDKTKSVLSKRQNITEKLPNIWELEFKKPFEIVNGKRRWNFPPREYNTSGIYILKERSKIIDLRMALSLYNMVLKLNKVKGYNTEIYTVALCCVPKESLKKSLVHFTKQIAKYPLGCTINQLYDFWEKDSMRDPSMFLQFQTPYEMKENIKRACTYRRFDYRYRSGVYLIRENGVVVYVGMSTSNLYQVLYNHFTPYPSDRAGLHYRVEYSQTLNIHSYDVAIIDIPGINKSDGKITELSTGEIRAKVSDLEKRLIAIYKPRDNRRDVPLDVSVESNKEDKSWLQGEEEAPF
ncbi:MAG: hypothetical protein WC795_00295 [Candidatus Paceibacterota bacterium]|jgi:hypothetical protein